MQVRERGHLIQHGRSLRRVKTRLAAPRCWSVRVISCGPAAAKRRTTFRRDSSPSPKRKPPFEIQMAVVYTPYFPRLRPVRVFHDATAEAGHTRNIGPSGYQRWGWLSALCYGIKVFGTRAEGLSGTGFPFDFSISSIRYGNMPWKGTCPPLFGVYCFSRYKVFCL